MSNKHRTPEQTVDARQEQKGTAATVDDATLQAIMSGDKAVIVDACTTYGVEVVKAAIEAYKATQEAEKARAREEEEAIAGIMAMVASPQPAPTVTDLSTRVLSTWGENPTQSEFLTSVLLSEGMDITTARKTHTASLTSLVADAIHQAYGTDLPASVLGHKTTWLNDKSTRTRIAAHISKPPKFYLEGRG